MPDENIQPIDWERQFNPRAAVPDSERYLVESSERAARVRAAHPGPRDVRYGPNPNELVDIYLPAAAPGGPAPVQVYLHGGYWRGRDKADFAHLAPTFTDAGAVAVLVNYDLCPTVTLDEIVAETYRCVAWVCRNIAGFGGDPERIYLSGSSAGAHLTAMALARDWTQDGLPADAIRAAAPITGIYDVAPVLNITVNAEIRLTPEMVGRNSPMAMPPRHGGPVLVAVGGAEPESWIAQSRDYAAMCRAAGVDTDYLEVPGENHFSLTASLADPQSPLARAVLQQMGLR
jgi:arylformamidase